MQHTISVSYTHLDVYKRQVDIITGTLGKALGGASGGYTSGRKEIIDLLRQRSRPYLFSNSLAPAIAGASIEMFNMLEESTELRDHLEETTAYYRQKLVDNGFDIIMGTHPCVPVMLYDEVTAAEFAERMRAKGVYVVAFSYPVVPKGKARIRTPVSYTHLDVYKRQKQRFVAEKCNRICVCQDTSFVKKDDFICPAKRIVHIMSGL